MSVCLLFFRRHCASVLSFCLASLTLCISSVSNAQSYNAAVNFTDSQIVAIPNPCNGSTAAFAGRFHRVAGMDFMQTCHPEVPPGSEPTNAALLNQNNGLYKPVADSAIDGIALPLNDADLNGDGYSDLILNPQFNPVAVGVQISNGDGTFKSPVYTPLSISNQNLVVASAVTGDFNNDGKMDVAILLVDVVDSKLNNTDEVVILQNTGSGGLKQVSSFMLSNLGTDTGLPILAAGKLNGDNNTDLAIAYVRPAGAVVPYFATGSGSFTRGTSIGLNEGPYSIAIGTFTTSGYGDIAVTAPSGIRVFLGSSAGTFTAAPETKYPYPAQVNTGIGLGDFDKDGKLDLAATDGTRILVYWGAGNGTFTSTVALSEWGSGLIVADMNGDGWVDLAATDFSGGIHILSNLGARNFRGAPATNSPNATGIVVADFNKDGKKDVAVVNTPTCKAPCSGTVSVFPGTGSTYFAAPKKYAIGMHGAAIAAGDLNGDGILDLVLTDGTSGDSADTSVLLGISGGGFAAAKNYTLGSLSNVAYLVDMNRDGKLDLVEAGGIALGKGNGTFGPLIAYPDGIAYSSASFASNLYLGVGHFNADSIPDVAIAYNSPDIGWLIYELIGNGTGHFTATQLVDSSALLQSVVGITVGKLTNGGPDDIVVANSAAACCGSRGAVFFGQPAIFFGDGKGKFTESPSGPELTDGLSPGGVVIADFNHDGWPDIGMVSGDQLQVALGQDGTNFNVSQVFSSTTGWNTNQSVGNLASADFNGDGWPDIVTANTYGITRLYGVPVPLVNPARLDFSVAGSKKITIKNTVTATQAIQIGVAGQAMSSFAIAGNTCPASLAPGANCTITVQYTSGVSGHGEAFSNLWVRSNGAFIAQIPLVGFGG